MFRFGLAWFVFGLIMMLALSWIDLRLIVFGFDFDVVVDDDVDVVIDVVVDVELTWFAFDWFDLTWSVLFFDLN